MPRSFVASLIVAAIVVLQTSADSSRQYLVRGVVTLVQPGQWIAVANETTDPGGVRITVRNTTRFQGFSEAAVRSAVVPGAQVAVWYGIVGERLPVATSVQALPVAKR